jgi:hypothetical protein
MTDAARGGDTRSTITPVRAGGEPWWAPLLRALRWLLGAFSLLAGFTWMLINLSNPSAGLDIVVGCVLAAGGLVLLMPHRIRLPRVVTAAVMSMAAVIGTAAGSFVYRTKTGYYVFISERGWPFHWAQRAAIADDPDTARRLALSADWHVDLIALGGNLLVFAYAGMLLVVLWVLIRRRRS